MTTDRNDWADYLAPDERLLWTGVPQPARRITLVQVAMAAFGLPFLGVGLFMVGGGLIGLFEAFGSSVGEGLLALGISIFGLPFLAAGGAMVFGPYLAARMAHKYVRYAISDRRVYVATQWFSRKMTSHPILPEATITLTEGPLDRVDLLIGHTRDSDGDLTEKRVQFDGLEDGRRVYMLLRQLQNTADTPEPAH